MTDVGIKEKLQDIQIKNAEYKETVAFLLQENSKYKQRYKVLKHLMVKLTNHLERNAQIFRELADDTKGVLDMSRTLSLHSPVSKKSVLYNSVNVQGTLQKPESPSPGTSSTSDIITGQLGNVTPPTLQKFKSPEPGTSSTSDLITGQLRNVTPLTLQKFKSPQPEASSTPDLNVGHVRNVTRRRICVEPVNIQQLSDMISNVEITQPDNPQNTEETQVEGLSTIVEEEEPTIKKATVMLKRLSNEVMEKHLLKLTNNNSFNTFSESILSTSSDNSFAPHKLELMQSLELQPAFPIQHNFVSVRKKERCTRSNSLALSPKKERLSSPDKKISTAKKKSSHKKELLSSSAKKSSTTKKKSSHKKELLSLSPVEQGNAVKENLSPKKENLNKDTNEKDRNSSSRKKQKFEHLTKRGKTKENSIDKEVERPPKRSARPTNLKEVSLMKKLRRS